MMRIITYNKYIITSSGSDNDGLFTALRDRYRMFLERNPPSAPAI